MAVAVLLTHLLRKAEAIMKPAMTADGRWIVYATNNPQRLGIRKPR